VRSHTLGTLLNAGLRTSRSMLPEFDGVAGVWFESEEYPMEAMNSPEMKKLGEAFVEDEATFIDHSKSSAFIVREHSF